MPARSERGRPSCATGPCAGRVQQARAARSASSTARDRSAVPDHGRIPARETRPIPRTLPIPPRGAVRRSNPSSRAKHPPHPHSPMHALLPHQLQDPQPSGRSRIPPDTRRFAGTRGPGPLDRSFGSAAGNRELPLDIGDAATADFPEANPTELTAPASVTASAPASLDLHPRGVEPIHSGRCAPERCSGHGTGALRAVTD